ncbi:MAG: helicase-associated domain-containing protein [Anaerolineae bacterium]|nr:helicase-associated domain-containing protein [Anaerolineae bacterium]
MLTLDQTLATYTLEVLKVIASRWDIEIKARDTKKYADQLAKAMLNPEKVADMWRRLTDEQRGALQTLLGSNGGKMLGVIFGRMFGEVRPMGPGALEREKPYLNPVSVNEALYYRGMISAGYGDSAKGSQVYMYVPTDLGKLMPTQETSYKDIATQVPPVEAVAPPENIRQADTAMVDDITTMMAFCQLVDVTLDQGLFPADHQKTLKPYLIGSASSARLSLMIGLAVDLGIAGINKNVLKPVGNELRKWLESSRPAQVKSLAEAWKMSTRYNELSYTPGLKVERLGNDPLLARQTVLTFMEMVPPNDWFPVDTFVAAVKEEEPEFQRPNGDYDSWYIRDAQSDKYLRGFESWDKVDGAMLRFILTGPMHGLGLLDTAQNGAMVRLTIYGRAFIGENDWPATPPETTPITIKADGVCDVPRATSRFDRFQLCRFTEWLKAGDVYQYRISAEGLSQATAQNIKGEQLLSFLKRATNDAVPKSIVQLIETWGQASGVGSGAGAQSASLSRMVVLRLPTPELLETLQATPAVRRYLGAQLGPAAVAIRPDQWEALVAALQASGVMVDVDMG